MIKKSLALGASVLTLMVAAPAIAGEHDASTSTIDTLVHEDEIVTVTESESAEVPVPTMSFGEWGFDTSLLSTELDPGDDFFDYANKKWIDANPLPPQFSRLGRFTVLAEKSTNAVKEIIDESLAMEAAPGSKEQRIADAYSSFFDTDAIDASGLTPAYPHLARIFGASDLSELVEVWATPGYAAPVGGFVTVDSKQPDQYIVGMFAGGLGLPDRDYYLDEGEREDEIRAKYKEYLAILLGEAGYQDAEGTAAAVYAFEETIAKTISWDRTVSRNRDLTYNAATKDELIAMAGDFPLAKMLTDSGLGAADKFTIFQQPPTDEEVEKLGLTEEQLAKIGKGVPGMFELLSNTSLPVLQAWTTARFMSGNASVLSTKLDNANFDFFGKTLRGQAEQRERWKRATDEVEGLLGEVLGKAYVERNFPEENKAAMDDLVKNLRVAMSQSIAENDWMDDTTKQEAQAKLEAFTTKIGYRENLDTYEGLEITANSPLANRMAAAKWGWEDNLKKLGGPIDKTEWFRLPQTVNAYYNPPMNEIVFPAGILQPPFFNISADPAVNYGAIGGVIGHEIGHGFDDQGSKSDGTGTLRDWWQPEAKKAFEAKGDALVAQYNAFCPYDDGETCMNGRLSLGENIGDVGGLSLAYRAYKLSLNGEEDKVIDGLTGDQRFFLAWAQVWRSMQTEENARARLKTGPHSLERYRVNGVVRNQDAWYEAFGVTEDDELYLPPEERVRIW